MTICDYPQQKIFYTVHRPLLVGGHFCLAMW